MRAMTQPPPSSRCDECGGELRFKLIETADRELNLENEISVCENCGREPDAPARRFDAILVIDYLADFLLDPQNAAF
jgi:hypothetical protein